MKTATMYKVNGNGVTSRKDTKTGELNSFISWLTSHNYKAIREIISDDKTVISWMYRKENCGTMYIVCTDYK